jgi:hypothetical protein
MHCRQLVIAAIAIVASLPGHCFGYNKAGHMVSGAIAYAALKKDNPDVAAKVVALLKEIPDFAERWKPRVEKVAAADRDMYLCMLAARWADDIRGEKQYDHPEWHYITLGFKPAGQPESVHITPPAHENIVRAFDDQCHELQSNATDAEKAIALCWVCHLVGDVHLPVHCTTLFTTDFPQGDRGATRFYIKPREHSPVTSLHYFWDDLVTQSEDFQTVRAKALSLKARPEFALNRLHELQEKRFENWAKAESCVLAREVVYRHGQLAGSPDMESAPILPEDYAAIARGVAERRIVLAGYRLAEVLGKLLK